MTNETLKIARQMRSKSNKWQKEKENYYNNQWKEIEQQQQQKNKNSVPQEPRSQREI